MIRLPKSSPRVLWWTLILILLWGLSAIGRLTVVFKLYLKPLCAEEWWSIQTCQSISRNYSDLVRTPQNVFFVVKIDCDSILPRLFFDVTWIGRNQTHRMMFYECFHQHQQSSELLFSTLLARLVPRIINDYPVRTVCGTQRLEGGNTLISHLIHDFSLAGKITHKECVWNVMKMNEFPSAVIIMLRSAAMLLMRTNVMWPDLITPQFPRARNSQQNLSAFGNPPLHLSSQQSYFPAELGQQS
jgi:hypothetical protein